MKKWLEIILMALLASGAGCGESQIAMKPSDSVMIGTWVPDNVHSSCPKAMLLGDTKLVLKQDGSFLAESFPKEISLGRQSSVNGSWSLKNNEQHWSLNLPWETPSKSILDGAQLMESNGEIFIEFFIDDPDLHQRLVLRRK